MNRSNNGSYGVLLILVTIESIGAFWLALFDVFGRWAAPTPVYAGVGCFVALTSVLCFAFFLVADIWLLLGNEGLAGRLLRAAIVNLAPCVFLAGGYLCASLRGAELQFLLHRVMGVLTQRMCVWGTVLVLGLFVRLLVQTRVSAPTVGQRSRFMQGSIRDLMALTAFTALGIQCATFWIAGSRVPRELYDYAFILLVAGIVEIVVLVAVLLPTVLVTFHAGWSAQRVLRVMALWGTVLGLACCFTSFIVVWLIYGGLAFTAFGPIILFTTFTVPAVAFVVWLFVRVGFHIRVDQVEQRAAVVTKNADTLDATTRRRPVISALLACLGLFFAHCLTLFWLDPSELIRTGDVQRARDFAYVHRVEGTWFRRTSQIGQQRIAPERGEYELIGDSEKLVRILRGIVPNSVEALAIRPLGQLTPRVLDEIAARNIVELRLYGTSIDADDFDRFCRNAKIQRIRGLLPDPNQFESLKQILGLQSVNLRVPLPWTDQWQQTVKGLPIRKMKIVLQREDLGDTSGISTRNTLQIHDSVISEAVVRQLNLLNLKQLALVSCRMDDAAARAFNETKISELVISGESIENDTLLVLATNTPKTIVRLPAGSVDPFFANKMFNYASNPISVFGRNGDLYEPNGYHLLEQISDLQISGVAELELLERLAKVRRNDRGEIVELSAAGVPISWVDFSSHEFKALTRLRIGDQMQRRSLYRQIAQIASLEELEIAWGKVRPSDLAAICQLPRLKRLQLPLANRHWITSTPEYVPLVSGPWLDTQEYASQLASVRRNLSMDVPTIGEMLNQDSVELATPLDSVDFEVIQHARQLESLFIPGHLLNNHTIPFLRALPKLRELHAVFSYVDRELLKQIVEMKKLEKLSMGMGPPTTKAIADLKRLPKLVQLQIVVFDTAICSDTVAQRKVTKSIEQTLPECDVHLIFFDSLPRQ